MLYHLKLVLYKNKLVRRTYYIFKKRKRTSKDIKEELISKYVSNKTFVDVGCMWGVNGYYTFLAEELGAKSSTGFDIFPATEAFTRTKHVKNSKVHFIQGDINSQSIVKSLSKFDVVYCTGLLYHVLDPLLTLRNLRQICNEVLVLGTAVIPENNGMRNTAIYYPFLSNKQRKLWNLNLDDSQLGITEPFDPKQGYGNWIWGFTPSCVESMLLTVGFDIREKHIGKFYSYFVCVLKSNEFLPVSGDWSVTKNLMIHKIK